MKTMGPDLKRSDTLWLIRLSDLVFTLSPYFPRFFPLPLPKRAPLIIESARLELERVGGNFSRLDLR